MPRTERLVSMDYPFEPVCVLVAMLLLHLALGMAVRAESSQLVVRWHGDYYQHLWDPTFPGGTNPQFLESRWLRGGARFGAIEHDLLDGDGDGNADDSRVYFPFSLEEPLNPPTEPVKPNGVFYHGDLPSATFYGGLSAGFLNYHTDRVQQAFIENDGAGGDLSEVGYYPSPYLPGGAKYDPEFTQGVENLQHSDGRYSKNHVGPQEDFAINIYRPDLPHPLDPQDNPQDNQASFHAAFLWKKADFLEGGDQQQVTLTSDSSFSFESTRWWDNVDNARWIIQDANQQLYISQFSVPGQQDNHGHVNLFEDPLSSLWAAYAPEGHMLDFDQAADGLTWLDPTTEGLFNDIQAFGLYIENDTPSGELTKFSLDEIQFRAQVLSPFSPADFNTDGSVDGDDLAIWQSAFSTTGMADADNDGDSDGNDFVMWQRHHATTGNAIASTLPEPSTGLLFSTTVLLLAARHRTFHFPSHATMPTSQEN